MAVLRTFPALKYQVKASGLVLLVHAHAGVLEVAHQRVFLLQQPDADVAAVESM